ncbi:uncharacterized protein [Eurosta solidaginis]|uniref:uncharacterized protein n=1 Tax=Eurosta solidaginis TaxID=178769 RepID=UPI003530F3BD
MTTTTTAQQLQIYSPQPNTYYQFQQKQQQLTNLNCNKQITQIPVKSGFSTNPDISKYLAISPLLPTFKDEDDESAMFNSSQFCELCCMDGQNPCQRCCDSRPLLSAAVLKSAAG